MDRVESLIDAGQSYSVKFLEFTRIYSRDRNSIICIFEGDDAKYYAVRINSAFHNREWHQINAKGKKTVMALFQSIQGHDTYKSANFFCFLDKDFEDWFINPMPDRIYVTPCYAIENLYVTRTCLQRILAAEFSITEFNENAAAYPLALGLYDSQLQKFLDIIESFNHVIKATRIMERKREEPPKLNLRNIKISAIASITLGDVVPAFDPANPTTLFKDWRGDTVISPDALSEAQVTCSKATRHIDFRGDSLLDFIRLFLSNVKSELAKKANHFGVEVRSKLSLSGENVVSELSQYADTPACLNAFLANAYEKFVSVSH